MGRAEVALGIDIGTGSTKAGLVDGDGRLLAVGRCGHDVTEPRPGWSESDPQAWLDSASTAIDSVLAQRPDDRLVAVGFSGQMHGVVLCDGDGEPIRPAVLWSDRRSQPYLAELRAELRASLTAQQLAALGNPVVAGMAGPTMAALAREEPGLFDRAATILQPKDWVRLQLTGELATDPSDASATLLWDLAADRWSAAACRAFEVEEALLPPVIDSGTTVGAVLAPDNSEHSDSSLGVPAGLPVACGGADTACALLGAGIGTGDYQVSTGTGGQIARPVEDPMAANPEAGTHLFRATEPSRWYAMAAIQNAGVAIDWALGVLGVDLDQAAAMVTETPIGCNGVVFVPYLTGERTPHLDVGLSGGWSGLRPGTDRSEMIRAVFEGVTFALRDALDALCGPSSGAVANDRPTSALLAGGGSTARWWQQMLADGLELQLIPHDAADASVRGAGLLAWRSVGRAIDPAAAVNHLTPIDPDPGAAEAYAEALARFRTALPTGGGWDGAGRA